MKMYVDLDQYLLTAAGLVPSTVVSYVVFYWLAKVLAKIAHSTFRLAPLGHVACIVFACAAAPIVALWFIDRPLELMDGSGKSLLVGAIAAFAVISIAQEYSRQPAENHEPSTPLRNLLSGATLGGLCGGLSFLFFALVLSNKPNSQFQFGLGSFIFFVVAGVILGVFFIRRRRS